LALVPNGNQVVGILKDLLFGRAAGGGFPAAQLAGADPSFYA
jgi:hypothetical protein